MAVEQGKRSLGYGKPPWVFKGSALYQLHLVKSETARACIPKEFRLVEAFGYTLGGFFLASYDDSPAGVFDELVVIAGLVWNRSTSCAWAAKVLVNSDKACYHGRQEVGLPSHVASFSKRIAAIRRQQMNESTWNMFGIDTLFCNQRVNTDVQITEIKCPDVTDVCDINLTTTGIIDTSSIMAVHASKFDKWMGPEIKMSLPSFSGGTEYIPNFLQYSCQIECRVQAVKPMKVSGAFLMINNEREQHPENHEIGFTKISTEEEKMRHSFSNSVMFSKPILALKFNDMKMRVEAPIVLSECSKVLGASTIKIDLDESTAP